MRCCPVHCTFGLCVYHRDNLKKVGHCNKQCQLKYNIKEQKKILARWRNTSNTAATDQKKRLRISLPDPFCLVCGQLLFGDYIARCKKSNRKYCADCCNGFCIDAVYEVNMGPCLSFVEAQQKITDNYPDDILTYLQLVSQRDLWNCPSSI